MSGHITPILQTIHDLVVERAEACGLPGWCRTGLVAGSAAWDVCCECTDGTGQLWVRLIDMQVDPNFPQLTPEDCTDIILLTVGIGSLRCVPTLDEMGNPPSAEDEQAAAELIQWDAEVVKDAVMCGLDERFWVTWVAVDSLGGCGGGEHQFRIPFASCRCDDCGESLGSPPGS